MTIKSFPCFLCIFFFTACQTGPVSNLSEDEIVLTEDGTREFSSEMTSQKVFNNTGSEVLGLRELSPQEKLMQLKDNEIEELSAKVSELQTETEELMHTIEAMEKLPLSNREIKKRTQDRDIPFKKCGTPSAFESLEWYKILLSELAQRRVKLFGSDLLVRIDPMAIIAGCYSEVGEIAIFLLSSDEGGKGFGILRYDTKMSNFQVADMNVFGKEKISVPIQFGKRERNIIHLIGIMTDGVCRSEMEFDYNFVDNLFLLKKNCVKCQNKADACEEFQN